jgi:hypothetical protein
VVVDLFRISGGKLAEHWDVLQDEVSAETALGRISMFDPEEGERLAHSGPTRVTGQERTHD